MLAILVNERSVAIRQGLKYRNAKTYLVYEGDVCVFQCKALNEEHAERQYRERFGVIGEAQIFIVEA